MVIVIGIAYFALSSSAPSAQGQTTQLSSAFGQGSPLALRLTDPPVVPAGTQSLVISYNSLEAHISGSSGSGWISSNASGSVDLLTLLNLSQTIGTVNIPGNSSVDMVRFSVTSASIEINNTYYNVTLPSSKVTANIDGGEGISQSSGVLLSLSPTIVTILTSNSSVFVMVPSVKAVVISNGTNQTTVRVGAKVALEASERMELERFSPNISISDQALSVSGNTTSFSFDLTDNSNQSVVVKRAGISGNLSSRVSPSAIDSIAAGVETELRDNLESSSACVNVSASSTSNIGVQDRPAYANQSDSGQEAASSSLGANISGEAEFRLNSSEIESTADSIRQMSGLNVNSSVCTQAGLQAFKTGFENRTLAAAAVVSKDFVHFRQMHFIVATNGSLILPYNLEDFNDSGYVLQAGQTKAFTFSGTVATSGNGVVITPVSGSTYRVVVGVEGGSASANVTAS